MPINTINFCCIPEFAANPIFTIKDEVLEQFVRIIYLNCLNIKTDV